MRFKASTFATAWLGVAVASVKSEDHPVLDRTILIEQHEHGMRLVATDRYLLLHAWAPEEYESSVPPAMDEAPWETAVVTDPHGRGAGLMKHLLSLAADADKNGAPAPVVDVTVGFGPAADDEGGTMAFPGLEAPHLIVSVPGSEQVALEVYEGTYPSWRSLAAGFEVRSTKGLAFTADMLSRLGKLAKVRKGCTVVWQFGGPEKAAAVEVRDELLGVLVSGVAMPVRLWSEQDEDEAA